MLINWHINEALKRAKISNITSQQIKNSYTVFINMEVDKPKYTSQSKSELASSIFSIDKNGKKVNLYRSEEFKKMIEDGDIFKILQEKARESLSCE
jgi:DNA gyrase/topoisomerase IV subunit B